MNIGREADSTDGGYVLILLGGKIFNYKTASEYSMKAELISLNVDCRGMGKPEMFLYLRTSDPDMNDLSEKLSAVTLNEKDPELLEMSIELQHIMTKLFEDLKDLSKDPSALKALISLANFIGNKTD